MPVGGQAHARLVTARFSSAQTLYFGYVGGAILTGADGTSVLGNPALAVNVTTTPFLIPTTNLLPPTPINTVAGTSYTFALTDAQGYTLFTSSSAITATVPMGVFPVGTTLTAEQGGAGIITFAPASGVTFNPTGSRGSLTQYAVVALFQKQTDVWTFAGSFT